jgi:SAM-dependent methyltransferase
MAVNVVCPAPGSQVATSGIAAPDFEQLGLAGGDAQASLLQLHGVLRKFLSRPNLAVYEAGGGSTSFLPPEILTGADVTVVDIDADQIANNDYAHHRILGDIQSHAFPRNSFDMVACYNVIEHLPDVEAALRRFCECIRSGGLVVIGAPNPASLSGVVTRYTPHGFHVWYYRNIMGKANAGLPGEPPFPVYFHPLVWPERLKAFARRAGFETVFEQKYESPRYVEMRARRPWLAAGVDLAARVLNALMLNKVDVRHGDYHLVLRKV